MSLVRRNKGGPLQLPDGVVSRMQYSPYRLQLARVRTATVDYLPLAREVAAVGCVIIRPQTATDADEPTEVGVDLTVSHEDAAAIQANQQVAIMCVSQPGRGPWRARVDRVEF